MLMPKVFIVFVGVISLGIAYGDDFSFGANCERNLFLDGPFIFTEASTRETFKKFHWLRASDIDTPLSNTFRISAAEMKFNNKMKIPKNTQLIIDNYELECWDSNWCHNHGDCVGVGRCACHAGWDGDECQYPVCQITEDRDECGVCNGDGSTCVCTDVLGKDPQEIGRLLLIHTNQVVMERIELVVENLRWLKTLFSFYDPKTEALTAEISDWLLSLQNSCNDCIEPIWESNAVFYRQLMRNVGVLSPCDCYPF